MRSDRPRSRWPGPAAGGQAVWARSAPHPGPDAPRWRVGHRGSGGLTARRPGRRAMRRLIKRRLIRRRSGPFPGLGSCPTSAHLSAGSAPAGGGGIVGRSSARSYSGSSPSDRPGLAPVRAGPGGAQPPDGQAGPAGLPSSPFPAPAPADKANFSSYILSRQNWLNQLNRHFVGEKSAPRSEHRSRFT